MKKNLPASAEWLDKVDNLLAFSYSLPLPSLARSVASLPLSFILIRLTAPPVIHSVVGSEANESVQRLNERNMFMRRINNKQKSIGTSQKYVGPAASVTD